MNRKERRQRASTGAAPHRTSVERGFALYSGGDLAGAESLFRQVLREIPDEPDATRLLGELLTDRGRTEEAIPLLQRLAAMRPGEFAPIYSLGNAYRLGRQPDAAIVAYQQAVALEPRYPGAHHGLGAALRTAEREREALESFRQAVRHKPDWALAWKDLGLTFAMLGELGMADAALRRAIALQPTLGDAHRHLAALRQDDPAPREIASLSARADDPATPDVERIELLFTLGRLADKAGAFDTAFVRFAAGNGLLRSQLGRAGTLFDRARLTRDVDRLIAAFTPATFQALAGSGDASEAPVFIVGMPRSGSSLFEQIAASHPLVFGAGERGTIIALAGRLGSTPSAGWTRSALGAAARDTLAAMRAVAGDAARIIDKMPNNIFQLGLIATLFPRARVVFCERDGRDLALSCFFQNFARSDGFDTDLGDIAFRSRELDRLTAHWRSVLPLRCMTLSYDALLDDPEAGSRRLVAFLGLEWDERCLAFHATDRVVRTASWAQVRQPLYQTARGRWKNYADRLGALGSQHEG